MGFFIADIEYHQPWLRLLALVAVPIFLLALRSPGRVTYSSFRALPVHGQSWRTSLAWVPALLLALSVAGLADAMAGPRTRDAESRVKTDGIAIMMAVDTSGSMRALDLSDGDEEMTRLDAVKRVFEEFVNGSDELGGRPDDAIGLVSFARYADTRAPLTLDHDILTSIASSLEIVTDRREDGTALGDGLGLAVERLSESEAKSRVAILLTDGVSNAGEDSPLAAAELARQSGIKVYTIGAGTNGVAPVRARDPFSGRTVLRAMPVEIDEQTLKQIAERTNGKYFRATDADGLRAVYKEIDTLERTELEAPKFLEYKEYFDVSLGIGLLFACLGWISRGTLFRRLP